MPLHLGVPELLIILFVVLLLFGAGRISQFGADLGRGIRELRASLKDDEGQNKGEAGENGKV